MGVSTSQVKELRVATGAPILDCKKALEHSKGDFDQAVDWLRKQGLSSVANKVGRDVSEGLIDSYIHPGNRVGVIVEVNCETDFVAKTDDFRALVHDILLHIAMANPLCIDKDDLPSESLSKEENLFREQALKEGKPENIVDKVVAGKIDKYFWLKIWRKKMKNIFGFKQTGKKIKIFLLLKQAGQHYKYFWL